MHRPPFFLQGQLLQTTILFATREAKHVFCWIQSISASLMHCVSGNAYGFGYYMGTRFSFLQVFYAPKQDKEFRRHGRQTFRESDHSVRWHLHDRHSEKFDSLSVDGFCGHCTTVLEAMDFYNLFCPCKPAHLSHTDNIVQRGGKM